MKKGWPEFLGVVVGVAVQFGLWGALAGGVWSGALGFGFAVGALWAGLGMAGIGVFLSPVLTQKAARAGLGLLIGPPYFLAILTGALVWVIRAII